MFNFFKNVNLKEKVELMSFILLLMYLMLG